MADGKTKSKDVPAQADKQASTYIAVKEGTEGAQAHVINDEQAQKNKNKND